MIIIAATAAALVYGAFLLANFYARRASRSMGTAERVWADLNENLRGFVESEPPVIVAQLAIAMAAAAGCGCFVRGVLISHYLPRVFSTLPDRASTLEHAFAAVADMPSAQRAAFNEIMGRVVFFDSFRNPLQGWLFRRLLRSFAEPKQSYATNLEVQMATASVLSKVRANRVLQPA